MKRFCKDLKDHATKIIDFKKKTMIPLTKEEEDNYNKENTCYICKKDFNNDGKVRDHCHFTGKYRGAAHNMCNLRYKIHKNNLGEYHDLYVRSDTLLLVDIFENFRQSCLKNCELDPAHFVSLPGLAWQACLKKTNVELELLTD